MALPVDLSDPNSEPTDDELIGLSTRAFAHVKSAQAIAGQRLRSAIATARAEAFRELAAARERLTRKQA